MVCGPTWIRRRLDFVFRGPHSGADELFPTSCLSTLIIDASKSTDPMRFTNHSCQANARLAIVAGRIEFFSLRAIEPGEEITVNYGETHHEGKLRCRCGAPNCIGNL